MKTKEEIIEVLNFLKEIEKKYEEGIPFEYKTFDVCIDCKEIVEDYFEHEGHTIVHQCFEHAGVSEWIKALEWVLKD